MLVKVPHENNEDPNLQKTQCHYLLIEDQSERLTEKEERRRALNMKDHMKDHTKDHMKRNHSQVEDVLPWITDVSAPSQQQFE